MSNELDELAAFLPSDTIAAWKKLAPVIPEHLYLAGGTAITVHLRHRVSRDLDFFSQQIFNVDRLLDDIRSRGTFAATLATEGTINGIFESTKVQFLEASSQILLRDPLRFGGIRVAALPDLMATKLKVIQDRGALRDYFDIMVIERESGISVEEGLRLVIQKYQPHAPAGVLANIIRSLGYLDDVEDDPSLPIDRSEIEDYWKQRQIELVRNLG